MGATFDELYSEHYNAIERYVRFKVSDKFDSDDILQEIYIAAYRGFDTLKNKEAFKSWMLSIARNKLNDYFRQKASRLDIPFENVSGIRTCGNILYRNCIPAVNDTLEKLGDKDKQILYLYFWKQYSQAEIAKKLGVPLGTVKRRLSEAKARFKEKYPYHHKQKGETEMKNLPEILPEFTIKKIDKPPFEVKWEELMGWFLVPKEGEKLSWAMYDMPHKKIGEVCHMSVVGKAEVHGIEGVEIISVETNPMECNSAGGKNSVERHFVAQLTDTHCRLLAETHEENGIKKIYTFLDGDPFLANWGFGEDNCGNEIRLIPKGDIVLKNGNYVTKEKEFLLDVVGRYEVTVNGKTYDTVCVMDCYTYIDGAATLQYLDRNGKTVLWRRFNRNDWAFDRYKKLWTELLPESERITVNGETYVNWYDCITDYIV